MGAITLPNFRTTADVRMNTRLKDGGMYIDWTGLSDIKVWLWSESQKAIAGRCDVEIDEADSTKLVCRYSASKPQYLGLNKIIVQATYMGGTKTYDKTVFNFVRWTADQSGTQITIDDPEVDVEIVAEDISSSVINEAVRAALAAADRANDVADSLAGVEGEIEAAEALRRQAENEREAAEAEREAQASADHSRAVTDHAQAEQDREAAAQAISAAEEATAAAGAAADLANEKAALVQDKLDTADADHVRAEGDHTRASSDHSLAGSDHQTAVADHTRAGSDHTLAAADHTQADQDHTRAQSDHNASAEATAIANNAGERANAAADLAYQKAGLVQQRLDTADADHTRADADHSTAVSDHTQAGNDHSTAESDHTQAASDHTRAEGDHSQAVQDHTTAEGDHAQATNDHTRAESDHAIAENDHATLDERIAHKADIDGYYESMAVGSAKTLAGNDTKVEDFFFKALDCADGLAKLNSARGKSLVWNQVCLDSLSRQNISVTVTKNGNEYTLTLSEPSDALAAYCFSDTIKGHKYFVSAECKLNRDTAINGDYKYGYFGGTTTVWFGGKSGEEFKSGFKAKQIIAASVGNQRIYFGMYHSGSADNIETTDSLVIRNPFVIDLTLMFGAGNEPATVDEFEAMFPLPYYDYNPGEIISNKTEEVKVVGFNQWDEEREAGRLNYQTDGGNNTLAGTRSKNYIRVIPGQQYYVLATEYIHILEYRADKSYIGYINAFKNNIYTAGPEAAYIRFYSTVANLSTDICINLSDPSRNGEYEPYKTNTIELNLPTLTGKLNGEGESVVVFPDGLKSAGSVYDEIVGNKAIKRVGVVDLGTLRYTRFNTTDGALFRTDDFRCSSNNILCARYAVLTQGTRANKCVYRNSNGAIDIIDSTYTDVATFKAAMDGVLLYYELETPEEYILDAPLPDTFQAYKGGTIKQLPENTSVPTTAPMVMTVTYAIDAVGTLVGLPRNYVSKESLQAMLNAMQSAGIIASYTMTYNENTGKYDFTFVAPTNS